MPWDRNEVYVMLFELSLIKKGIVTVDQMLIAAKRQQLSRVPIGRLAIEHGKMSMAQVFDVLAEQADNPKSFGQLAIEMDFLTEEKLGHLLLIQSNMEQSLSEILVEMGCASREQIDVESRSFHRQLRMRFETFDIEASPC